MLDDFIYFTIFFLLITVFLYINLLYKMMCALLCDCTEWFTYKKRPIYFCCIYLHCLFIAM